jgi:hypothetical protein
LDFREAWPKGSLEGPVYVKVTLELSMSDTKPATSDLVLLDIAIPGRREGALTSATPEEVSAGPFRGVLS